jgi:hypothetical protein
MAKITKKDVQPVISKLHLTLQWKKEVRRIVEKEMKDISNSFIKSFMDHPVTKEIKEGPNGSNISGTLGGYSNLFGFIGFYEGDNPILPLENLLKKYSIRIYSRRGNTTVNIEIPTLQDAYAISPMPWASGRSWARGIEVGISGLGRYLAIDAANSRSGEGIQTSKKVRGGTYTRRGYLSPLFKKYKNSIEKLKNQFK